MARKPIRVSQLNAYVSRVLASDGALSDLLIAGEIVGFKRHDSGHGFFNLKDDRARVSCFLPAGILSRLDFMPENGMQVVCEGYLSVYEPYGTYSVNIRTLKRDGVGALSQAFEERKALLAARGYFDPARKRPIPPFPRQIALVTSASGAAVEDMVKILTTRNRVVTIRIFPTLVQGDGAAAMIAGRIREVNERFPDTDVLITGRGGGSPEDLWAFNERIVADAIYASKIPVISAVGHETDFTIADFTADLRAETPTAAAMLAVPDTEELAEDTEALYAALRDGLSRRLRACALRVTAGDPARQRARLTERIERQREAVYALRKNALTGVLRLRMERAGNRVSRAGERLELLNPLNLLSKGYAIVAGEGGKPVTKAASLRAEEQVFLRFADGRARARICGAPELRAAKGTIK
ncbi:MAG: exodeoxyribonuclease VII large subunit [Clostridiales bacterium]|nr:exodeoxyribonuclease VII large subunit [Clostridiales bacterium]